MRRDCRRCANTRADPGVEAPSTTIERAIARVLLEHASVHFDPIRSEVTRFYEHP